MDFGHILYEQKRKSKLARKKVRAQDLKEIQLRPNTDKHDFETKLEHARDFMDKGHKVKFTVKYRGREMAHYERGTMILQRAEAELGEVAEVEMRPSSRGRTQSMVLAPKKRKKDAKEREPAGAAAPASQPASPGSVPG